MSDEAKNLGTSDDQVGGEATSVPSEAFVSGYNAGRFGDGAYDVQQAWKTFRLYGGADDGREALGRVELRGLRRVFEAAAKCVRWQEQHDTFKCIHEVPNYECGACAGEPPHFPVGIDEFTALAGAVRDQGLRTNSATEVDSPSFVSPAGEELAARGFARVNDPRSTSATVRDNATNGVDSHPCTSPSTESPSSSPCPASSVDTNAASPSRAATSRSPGSASDSSTGLRLSSLMGRSSTRTLSSSAQFLSSDDRPSDAQAPGEATDVEGMAFRVLGWTVTGCGDCDVRNTSSAPRNFPHFQHEHDCSALADRNAFYRAIGREDCVDPGYVPDGRSTDYDQSEQIYKLPSDKLVMVVLKALVDLRNGYDSANDHRGMSVVDACIVAARAAAVRETAQKRSDGHG